LVDQRDYWLDPYGDSYSVSALQACAGREEFRNRLPEAICREVSTVPEILELGRSLARHLTSIPVVNPLPFFKRIS
jgi:hypothetical protein